MSASWRSLRPIYSNFQFRQDHRMRTSDEPDCFHLRVESHLIVKTDGSAFYILTLEAILLRGQNKSIPVFCKTCVWPCLDLFSGMTHSTPYTLTSNLITCSVKIIHNQNCFGSPPTLKKKKTLQVWCYINIFLCPVLFPQTYFKEIVLSVWQKINLA